MKSRAHGQSHCLLKWFEICMWHLLGMLKKSKWKAYLKTSQLRVSMYDNLQQLRKLKQWATWPFFQGSFQCQWHLCCQRTRKRQCHHMSCPLIPWKSHFATSQSWKTRATFAKSVVHMIPKQLQQFWKFPKSIHFSGVELCTCSSSWLWKIH